MMISDTGWAVLENIVWAIIFVLCVLLLDGHWKWFCIVPVLFLNSWTPRKRP